MCRERPNTVHMLRRRFLRQYDNNVPENTQATVIQHTKFRDNPSTGSQVIRVTVIPKQ